MRSTPPAANTSSMSSSERTSHSMGIFLPLALRIFAHAFDCGTDAAGEVDVVVLQQDHVEESHAVVLAAAQLHGHFVQHAHPGRGLARVEDLGVETLQPLDVNGRLGRHAAHALHDVQQDALGLKQRAQASRDVKATSPGATRSPSCRICSNFISGSRRCSTSCAISMPAIVPSLLAQEAHASVLVGGGCTKATCGRRRRCPPGCRVRSGSLRKVCIRVSWLCEFIL